MLKLFLILVIIEYYVFAVYFLGHHQHYIIIWFAPCAGKMNQILGCDFDEAILPAQDYPPCPARQSLAKLFNFFVCNPCQSSPSLTILVPLWFIIISLVFFYLCKALFSGFLQFTVILSMLKKKLKIPWLSPFDGHWSSRRSKWLDISPVFLSDRVEAHRHVKKECDQSSHLDRTSLVNKGYVILIRSRPLFVGHMLS